VESPYNYGFANGISQTQADFLDALLAGNLNCTPAFQQLELGLAVTSLAATGGNDLWGPGRCTTLYVKPTTLRLSENGYAILTSRNNIQRVVHDFCRFYKDLVDACATRGEFPMNGPLEIRVTGLDQPGEVLLDGAREPQLSPLRPRPDRPAWDCAVWLDALTFPGTPGANRFYTELENWILERFRGDDAGVRVEWSKGWGYTEAGPWTRPELLAGGLGHSFSGGQAGNDGWAAAQDLLNAYDPHRIFSNPFLDRLLG
jgi:FAD/FMN-containing dehydrogenase